MAAATVDDNGGDDDDNHSLFIESAAESVETNPEQRAELRRLDRFQAGLAGLWHGLATTQEELVAQRAEISAATAQVCCYRLCSRTPPPPPPPPSCDTHAGVYTRTHNEHNTICLLRMDGADLNGCRLLARWWGVVALALLIARGCPRCLARLV